MPDQITNIPPPRVPIVDPQTGFISREWYRFLYNLFTLTGEGRSSITTVDAALEPVTQPSIEIVNNETQTYVDTLPLQQLGTFAQLQQANLPWTTFDTTPQSVPNVDTGTLYWNDQDNAKTLNLIMEDTGDIVQKIGQDTYYRVKASANITKGQVVMFTGAVGASGGLEAAPATGLSADQEELIMGIATENILNNEWGYITWFGEIRKVNTTGGAENWIQGQILYYNPAVTGGLTKFRPNVPNPVVIMAAVVHVGSSNGILFVRPTYIEGTGTIVTSPPVTKTADFIVGSTDTWLINNKSGSTCTVTLPSASANYGRTLTFINYQDEFLVSASSNVVPRDGGAAGTAILADQSGDWATMVSDGTNWVIMQAAVNNCLLIE